MNAVELIAAKQRGEPLSTDQISWIVKSFTIGDLPDYQMAALLMAIYFQKVSQREGRDFLSSMISSGRKFDLSHIRKPKVDKHSTGGVGDKTSLIIAPVIASLGIAVPMISGRALGHTGGTLDKLQSIPGFQVALSEREFITALEKTGCAFGAQTAEMVPADRKLYALRDVTSTVAIPPLIAASILSKKIAEGAESLVMDIKVGRGGFLPSENEAQMLASMIVDWANEEGIQAAAFGSDADQPLGTSCGNAPEVLESLDILRSGTGDARLLNLCQTLGASMILFGGKAASQAEAELLWDRTLRFGDGFEKFKEIAETQGSSAEVIENFVKFSTPEFTHEITATRSGFISDVNAREVGYGLVSLGAGRFKATDDVDHTAGVVFHLQTGDQIRAGDVIAKIGWSRSRDAAEAISRIESAIRIADNPPASRPLLRFYCDKNGMQPLHNPETT